jgi:hypothetical protein
MPKEKRKQSPTDMLIEVARALSGGQAKNQIPIKLFADTNRKVGLKSKERLAWAVRFAQEPIASMTPGDWYNAQLEAGAFLHPEFAYSTQEATSLPFGPLFFLSAEQVTDLKQRFIPLIKAAVAETEFSFSVSQVSVTGGEHGVSYAIASNLSDLSKHAQAQIEQAMLRLAQLLSENWGHVGLCDRKKHGCGKYFVKSRKDREFCSKTCLNRSTTYRQRGVKPAA